MMWARIVECMLGCWFLVSPFVFGHSSRQTALWINDLAAGATLIVLSLASYGKLTAWAHWLLIPLGAWLVVFGRVLHPMPLQPAAQNQVVVGLLLLMFAIIPNEASLPPHAWRSASSTDELPDPQR